LAAQKRFFTRIQPAHLSLEQLMSIKVVTASGYLQTTSEAPATITVITAQQSKTVVTNNSKMLCVMCPAIGHDTYQWLCAHPYLFPRDVWRGKPPCLLMIDGIG